MTNAHQNVAVATGASSSTEPRSAHLSIHLPNENKGAIVWR